MIEQCGWKGKKVGNVGMHKDQALVLVNYGGADGRELLTYAAEVQKSVKENFGVIMEAEVNVM
jgi:UDP-N-acetylmuramate dehydrogenase